jgi:organic radical activating enzyme
MGLAFFVTEKCQFNCEYCDIPTIKNPKHFDPVLFLRYVDFINDHPFNFITMTGGEPGLLSEVHISLLFTHIVHPINVNTNGLFIKKGYYEKYKNKIQMLDYHIVNTTIDHELDEKGRYILVSHAKNQEFILCMQAKYPHIDFIVRAYDDKLNKPEFQNNDLNPKEKCINAIKEIDWVNGKLVDCCKSPISSPKCDLSERSLKDFLNTKLSRRWHACEYCQWYKKFGS